MIENLNNFSFQILLFFWKQSLSSVPIFIFALLLTLLFRHKYANVLYFLWSIFLVRLVIPVEYLLSGFLDLESPVTVIEVVQVSFQPGETFSAFSSPQNVASPELSLSTYLLFTWFTLFTLLFLRYMFMILKVKRIIRKARPVRQLNALSSLTKWKSVLGIKRNISISFSENTTSAFNSGLFRPQIILPVSHLKMAPQKLDVILGHECVHIKRADNLKLALQQFVQMVFLFNPLVWISTKMLSIYREKICDAAILFKAKVSRKFYGRLLLDSIRQPGLAGINTGFNINYLTIKSRLLSLNRSQSMKKPGIFLVLISAMFLFAFNTGNASEVSDKQNTDGQNITFTTPIKTGRISSKFGMRLHPFKKKEMHHDGVDVASAKDTPVYAASDGHVSFAEKKGNYGKLIVINHTAGFQTRYAQLSEIKVELEQQVKKGELIGLVGSSGTSTAPHLHFELRKDKEPIDPQEYIRFELK